MKWYSLLLGALLVMASCTNGSSSSSKEQGDSTKVEKPKVLSAEGIYTLIPQRFFL